MRNAQRGNSLIVSVIVMSALLTLATISALQVQGGVSSNSTDRYQQLANYAAESGIAVATEFMRQNVNQSTYWSAFVSQNNTTIQSPSGITGNDVASGTAGNLLSTDTATSYKVEVFNNKDDPSFAATSNNDSDGKLVLRSTGRGPNGAEAVIEVEIAAFTITPPLGGRPCPSYAQKNVTSEGSGRNDCLLNITSTDQATFRAASH